MCICVSVVMGEEDEELQSWGWTDLSCYSSLPSDSEQDQRTPSSLMSRRSLRLDGGLLDRRPAPRSSASLVVGGAGWRSGGSRRSQRHSASCSESLLVGSSQFLHNSSVNSVASDASLISSLLDESSIQESTLVETFWGLDQDADPKESTIIASESSSLIGSDSVGAQHSDQALSRLCCKDCDGPSAAKSDKEPKKETSTIYYRGRKSRAARSRNSGVMALTDANPKELHPVGSLCESNGSLQLRDRALKRFSMKLCRMSRSQDKRSAGINCSGS